MDYLDDFIGFMTKRGCAPAHPVEIVADDKIHRYRLADESNGKRSARYQLRVDGEFAVGWCHSFKEGVTHKYSAKSKAKLSPEEKKEWAEKYEAQRTARATKIREEKKAAALRAARVWNNVKWDGTTAYLERKKANLNSAGIYRDLVCVPVRIGGALTSMQFISPSGEKRFMKGSELAGGSCALVAIPDDTSIIVICEGFATGDSILQAIGFPTVVAFNAANLIPVGKEYRKRFPQARIIFAADNDQWTKRPDGTSWNPGLEYARQAALAIGGAPVIWPVIAEDDEKHRTDFNDIFTTEGAEVVKARILEAAAQKGDAAGEYFVVVEADSPSVKAEDVQQPHHDDQNEDEIIAPAAPIEAYADMMPSLKTLKNKHWQELLLTNAEGKLKSASLRNAILFLQFHQDFEGIFSYNEFHQNIMITKCPPWEREAGFEVKRLHDVAITNCTAELEKYCINVGTDKAFKAIQAVAMERKFHPARDYFNGLKWDGRKRLQSWLTYYLGCESESAEYLAFVGTKWLTAAVTRVFKPGCKFDHVLIIEGPQGRGKSEALRNLATFGNDQEESYFTDSVTATDIQNKDTIMKIQGSIIIELAELSGFSKKDDEEMKRWITLRYDDARLPYARDVTRFDRQWVLSATTNKHDYLKDPTSNRRYWPTLSSKIDLVSLKMDREQLWAEAVQLYREGLYLGPTAEEEKLAHIERQKRLMIDPWTDKVLTIADDIMIDHRAKNGASGFKIEHVLGKLGLALRDQDDRAGRRVSNILQINGFENPSIWNPDLKRTQRLWTKEEERNGEDE